MEKITFCIPTKNNLRYLKTCIPSIRENASRPDHEIIIFVDSDNDGAIEWLEKNKVLYNYEFYINPKLNIELYGIGKAYDFCIEKSNTEICMVFHADMMLGLDADLNAYKHLKKGKVVCSTRIEPPLHPNNGEKIIEDFGLWPEDFNKEGFKSSVIEYRKKYKNKTTKGMFAPWMIYKEDFNQIGGHDPRFKSAREDSDIFNRFKLKGYELIQSWDSLVYHLTGRGGQFQTGDTKLKDKEWQILMDNSTKEFIRKWGTTVNHTQQLEPIIPPKYHIGLIMESDEYPLLNLLEPYFSNVYVSSLLREDYIKSEQPNTIIDLSYKIKPYDNEKNNEIFVTVNGPTFTQQDFDYITNLPLIIKDSGEKGRFQLGNIEVEIIQMNEYQNTLIKI
jgi:glycosyltransferase involved in cell wall biosynthesis